MTIPDRDSPAYDKLVADISADIFSAVETVIIDSVLRCQKKTQDELATEVMKKLEDCGLPSLYAKRIAALRDVEAKP